MQVVQIEIDEKTLAEVDEAIEVLRENRQDVFREAFRELAKRKKKKPKLRVNMPKPTVKIPSNPTSLRLRKNN